MKKTVRRIYNSFAIGVFVLAFSGCSHYAKTAFYTGGPDWPRDIIRHSETWKIVDLHPGFTFNHVKEGDILRFEHSGNRKRPKVIWDGEFLKLEIEMREIKQQDDGGVQYDFVSAEPLVLNGHYHRIRVGKNIPGTDVDGEIVFLFEDCGEDADGQPDCINRIGSDHGGHAGGGR